MLNSNNSETPIVNSGEIEYNKERRRIGRTLGVSDDAIQVEGAVNSVFD